MAGIFTTVRRLPSVKCSVLNLLKCQQHGLNRRYHCVLTTGTRCNRSSNEQYSIVTVSAVQHGLNNCTMQHREFSRTWLQTNISKNFNVDERGKGLTSLAVEDLVEQADMIAYQTLKLREAEYDTKAHKEERDRLLRNVVMFNVKHSRSENAETERAHDVREAQRYFKHLGFSDVKIEKVERLTDRKDERVPPLRVTLQDSKLKEQIISTEERQRKRNPMYSPAGKMTLKYDRTSLQNEVRQLLRKEVKLRNKASKINSDPWMWRFKNQKVVSSRNFHNPDVMIDQANELKARSKRFQAMAANDEEEMIARQQKATNVRMFCAKRQLDTDNIQDIVDYLKFDYRNIESITRLNIEFAEATPVMVTLEDPDKAKILLSRAPRLRDAPTQWMRWVYIEMDLTCVHKYIDELLKEEVRIRNDVADIKREPPNWHIRKGRVVNNVEDYKLFN